MRIKQGYRSVNGDYIFSKTDEKVRAFKLLHPNIKVIDLGVGDVKLPIMKSVSRKMRKAAYELSKRETFVGYLPDNGCLFLRKMISDYYRKSGCDVSPEEIFITGGAKPALADLTSLADFDKAFVPEPNYPLYLELCSAYGIPVVKTRAPSETYADFAKENDCDLCMICSPCNPTGEKVGLDVFRELAEFEKRIGGVIIDDAAYAFFDDAYKPPFETAVERDTVIEVRTFSKSLSFTGIRCGFVAIGKNNPLYKPFSALLSLKYNGVNVTAQRAAAVAFSEYAKPELALRRAYYRKNAEVLAAPFVRSGYEFTGGVFAPYVFVDVKTSGVAFADELLSKAAVCVTPGEGFGGAGKIRLSCLCTAEDALEGAERIARFLGVRVL